jgi:predicted RNA binding protein YcfA (HicA-like mRNA interferase family)
VPKLPRISGGEAVRALERLGFTKTRQTGSHVILKKPILDDEEIQVGEVVCVPSDVNSKLEPLAVFSDKLK